MKEKTALIDSWGVNPPAKAHGEEKEAHKGQGSVTGKRWRQEERGWRGEEAKGEVSLREQLLC